MKKLLSKYKRNKNSKKRQSNYGEYERSLDIRRKSLSILDSKLKFSFTHLNTLLEKINNVKELVVYNKYDTRDLKSLKNLDNNALLFSKNMNEEIKKTSELLDAYNLSPQDLDNFMNELKENSKNRIKIEEIQKLYNIKKDYNNLKKEFDLTNFIKNQNDKKMNESFLKGEKKLRDLYNLKLELFLREERKKIGENQYFEIAKKAPICIKEKDKRTSQRYSTIKSKYFENYKLSKSFEIEEAMREKDILKEEENENNKENELTTKNKKEEKNYFFYYSNNNMIYNPNKYIKETIKENDKNENENNKNYIKKNTKLLLNRNNKIIKNNNQNNNIKIKSKPTSANINKNNKYSNYMNSMTLNTISQVNINTIKNKTNNFKKIKKNRVNSADSYQRTNYNITKSNYNQIFRNNNFTEKNKRNRPISPLITSKPTFYSSTTSSRPISAFSSIYHNNTFYNLKNNNNKVYINKSFISKYKKKSYFTNYINEINKIIKYSDYTINNFKKSSNKLKNKKLFVKSNSEIFERRSLLDLEKVRENLKLDKNRHSSIDDKKLIFNNSKRVKLMLTPKNKNILNTILMELLVKQKRVNNYYSDLSHYEKMMLKFERNKKFEKITNEMMNYEKRFDKETILEIFKQDEEKIMEYLKEIKNKEKYDEDEWKHILLKHKNMRIINATKINNMVINGNLHKKHLVSKFKKEKY